MPDRRNPALDYDAATKWPRFPDWTDAALIRDGWSARPVPGLDQTLVSGIVDDALAAFLPGVSATGLWAVAEGEPSALRLARDRVLIVSRRQSAVPVGWDMRGFAVSPASDAYFVVDIEGKELAALVAEATTADLDGGSRSAAIMFAGINAVLYRSGEHRARLHVETGFAPYLWRWLETR